MKRITIEFFFFFLSEETPAQIKPAVTSLSFFFPSNFWHDSTAGKLPRHVGECAARGLRGKIQPWMEIFKGPCIPLKLAFSLPLYPIEVDVQEMLQLLICKDVGARYPLLCAFHSASPGLVLNATNTFHSPSESALNSPPPSPPLLLPPPSFPQSPRLS